MGTNNKELLADPLYLGNTHPRLKLEQYEQFFDVFMERVTKRWPDVLVQFEDFSNEYSFDLLERYRHKYRCFNDDIQGTGAVVLAGFLNAVKASGVDTANHRIVFHGAGSASIGVAHQIVTVICEQLKISREQAYKQFWLVDTKGLVTSNRGDKLVEYKLPFARSDVEHQLKHLPEIVDAVRPTAIIGLSGDPGAFSPAILKRMAELNKTPIVFALSNPTSKAECTAEEAFVHTDGRAIFACGSPFDAVEYKGKLYEPAQGNNMYIFPGLGLGAFLCKAHDISDGMFIRAAKELAASVTPEQIASSMLYPSLERKRALAPR
jgi:malate dehydrogenase (oxaloacetate-decarboxylating)(NADP+)